MLKIRIILLIVATIMVVLLYNLPKVVVDNDPNEVTSTESATPETNQETATHTPELSEEDLSKILSLKESYRNSENKEKSAIFADSLARAFKLINKFDSAAKYTELVATHIPNEENWEKAGYSYYEAFEFAMDPKKAAFLGKKAREYFQKLLDLNPENASIKVKVAMTYISSTNPMQGIAMLREILDENPDNDEAIFNLGVLSMRSGQYDKAVKRFEKLVSLQPENYQAHFYLGLSHKENGNLKKAKEEFEKVKELSDDEAVNATVDSYLQNIK